MHLHATTDLLGIPGIVVTYLAFVGAARLAEDAMWAVRGRWMLHRPTRRPWTWRVGRRWYAPGAIVGVGNDHREARVVNWAPLDREPHAVVQVHVLAPADGEDHCQWLPLTALTRPETVAS